MIKPNFEFQEQFGKIVRLIPDGQLAYESRKGKLYSILENIWGIFPISGIGGTIEITRATKV